jgi:hypothetical protein
MIYREIGNKIKKKDKENISELMEAFMKASGNKIKKKMVMEKLSKLMDTFLKGIMKIPKEMDLEYFKQKEIHIKGNGKIIN